MSGFPASSASKMGNLIVNPGSSTPGALETYLREPRWWLLDMSPFWGFPPLRGENLALPEVDGQRAYQHFLDQGVYSAPLRATGTCGASGVEPSGVAETRFFTQLRRNLDHLSANVHTPVGTTRSARLTIPDMTAIDFEGQFALSLVKQTIADAGLVLDVTVPDGRIE